MVATANTYLKIRSALPFFKHQNQKDKMLEKINDKKKSTLM
jgi:hypothetical protein